MLPEAKVYRGDVDFLTFCSFATSSDRCVLRATRLGLFRTGLPFSCSFCVYCFRRYACIEVGPTGLCWFSASFRYIHSKLCAHITSCLGCLLKVGSLHGGECLGRKALRGFAILVVVARGV